MGTSALLSLGMRAMFANQAALNTVGQNIANANTPGYSRQQVVLTTPEGQFTGSGFFGKGVNVQTVTRAYNEFLTKDAAASKSQAFMDSTRLTNLQQLEKLFPPGDQGLGQAANQFLNAMVDVASRPSDPSARQVVLGRAQELAARYASAGQQLADLQAGLVSDLRANINVVNQLATQIAAANDQIARSTGSGHTANDLLDQRDQLINKLSEYVQVSTLPSEDGTVGIFIGGGQRLVLGSIAQQLDVAPDTYDGNRVQLSITESSGKRRLDESVLTGGSITALLRYQNQDLQDARNLVGQLAVAFAKRVNDQQALGLDSSTPPGKGSPIFSFAEPKTLPASTNARNPDGTFASMLTVQITDASRLRPESYVLKADPSGTPDSYIMTTRPGGTSVTLTAAQIESQYGFRVTASGAALGPEDAFLVEPVAQAAVTMKRTLDSTNGIAAAAPITAVVDVNNTGTATVESLYVVNSKYDPALQPMSVLFGTVDPVDQSVNYTLTLADGSTLPGKWRPGAKIGNEPAAGIDLGFELTLNGVPRDGDVITTGITQFPASNNANAKAFLNIQTEMFVGRTPQPDGSVRAGATPSDAYAAAMTNIASRVQGAQYLSEVSTSVASNAEATRAGQVGVNMDEEAARLMQYQQGYQAAAKMLQTAQTIFDELLKLG
ncbi:flagellar hook-associated protein FlgK [Pelomonas sp. SE-A7]|uniref:flagellar hook-associated protein FlgK n=1 Tax=Pelomonas sp. SE-A7 TaxID=3054953 RepID=UPI00259CEEC8|nr:flagellar hook-associated protein FlgK [Pelomonas sp. SE-A7]MDM4764533.1 flagellar hook-associated protein FlgK [Pelomonas sp. SE-A7]